MQSRPDIELVGEAACGREVLTKTSALNPDVVMINAVSIPEIASLDFVDILAQQSLTIRAVLTILGGKTAHLSSLLETAVSVMEHPSSKDRLAILLSVRRDAALPVLKSPEKVGDMRTPQAVGPSIAGLLLSPREHQVLLWLAEGHSNREIAEMISRSTKTVEAYRANIKRKLGLHNRADIVRYVWDADSCAGVFPRSPKRT